ncbi:MAG TPA: DEAD/DEAH box helicase, partial [Archangium sp.]|nr:DEAD/DEAH box helicase [Archangium sp.]
RSARRALAEALARGEAEHPAVRRNQPAIDEVRELWRRSGGRTAKLGAPEQTALYEAQLEGVTTLDDFLARPLALDLDALVPPETREQLLSLPDAVTLRDREVALDYEVEQDEAGAPVGVVRLDLPEKLARSLVEEELPLFDRPVRFVVGRGRRGALRADSLLELQELLDMPWMPDELEAARDEGGGGRTGRGKGPRRPKR